MPVLSEDYGDALANDGVTYSDDFVFGEDESVLLGTLQIYLNSPLLCISDDNQDFLSLKSMLYGTLRPKCTPQWRYKENVVRTPF